VNRIDVSELYASEDEYQADRNNPYRGLSDADALELSMYQEEEAIEGKSNIILVRHRETGKRYIKKLLTIYNKSVYAYLMEHPIERMPRIINIFESSNCLIVIEEFILGLNLEHILEKEGPLSEEKAIDVALYVCDILNELHNLPTPIIHRDVKPSNIIITIDSEVNLLDMNVAKWYDPEKTDDTRYMGTQYYAAPEQVGYGLTASSAKADIYALGILLNVMVTGSFPKEKRATGELWNIIERCISLNAEDRYTAKELHDALLEVKRN
jgi:serine/threonine protein kinase